MVAVDILTRDTHTSSSSSSARSKESYTPYQDYTHSSPQEPLLSTSAPSSSAAATSTTRGQHSDHHHHHHHHHRRPSLSRSSSSSSSSYSSPTTKHNHQKQSTFTSGASLLTGCVYSSIGACYNRITAYLFPNEPEPLDLPSTLFFIAQVPFLFWVFLTWIPSFVVWFVGWRVSQAGDRGKGQGMRKTWSLRLALSLSFLKVYLRHADKLTIEECQSRSRSIPFMTAPAGIRIKKVKIPAFPFRNRAESIVYEHLTEEERGWLHWNRKGDETKVSSTTQEQMEEGEGLSVKVQREMEMELASIQTAGSNHNDVRKKNNRKKNNKEDQFAEGLDAEWLEYVGPAETDADKAEMTSENMAAVLYFHGGGYYTGSKEEHRVLIGPLVRRLGKHVRILIINYRLAPQHPFPAALVDALSSYMWLMDQSVSETFGFDSPPATPSRPTDNFQPRQIVFMGDSAGGGLALSLSLLLRDHASPAIPQPVKIVTWSPWLDLTQALPSFKENALTDCIPYEDFTHLHSDAVDGMFRHMEAPEEAQHHQKGAGGVRQRAQVYCPDTCLRMKYVSPLYETDFRGIPEVLIVCGSAERFANECILLASRLEDQQLTCRIDIHEDMPHIFPLFRFHPSSMEALDRTSAYIRAAVSTSSSSSYTPFDGNIRNGRNRSDSVVIPISPSSSSCSVSSSGSNSPSLSPPPTSRPMKELSRDGSSLVLMDDEAEGFFQHPRQRQQDVNDHETVRRVGSSSSLSSADSSSTSVTQQQQQQGGQEQRHRRIRSAQDAAFDPHSVQHSNNNKKKRTSVNVIDLSGSTVMSFHKQTRFGTPSDRDRALLELETQEEQAALLDDAGGNGLGSSRRRRRRERLTLQDVVSDATLYEWEVLLKQGYVPTRLWPLPSSGGSLSRFSRQRRV